MNTAEEPGFFEKIVIVTIGIIAAIIIGNIIWLILTRFITPNHVKIGIAIFLISVTIAVLWHTYE